MTIIKQFFKEASVKVHMCIMIICYFLIIFSVWIYSNVSHVMFGIMLILAMLLFIIDAYYAINRSAQNYLERFQKKCFEEIKTFLSNNYVRIYVFSDSNLDKSLTYYGKINEDDTLSVYTEVAGVKKEFDEFSKNYMWFMKNFYTM